MNITMDEVKQIVHDDYYKKCIYLENLLHDFAEKHDLYMHANYCEPFHEMRIFVSPKKYWAWQRDFLNDVLDIIIRINIRGTVPHVNWDAKMLTMINVNLKDIVDTKGYIPDTTFSLIKDHLIERYDLKEEDDDMARQDITSAFYEGLLMADFAHEEKHDYTRHFTYSQYPEIDKVIYNDPATIVFWKDGQPGCKIKRSDFGLDWNKR